MADTSGVMQVYLPNISNYLELHPNRDQGGDLTFKRITVTFIERYFVKVLN